MKPEQSIVIAFEGMHRSGKETQLVAFQEKLRKQGIPTISIKGEGYRSGAGVLERDPKSDFWQRISKLLQNKPDFEVWENASHRLAQELVAWRKKVLAKKICEALAPFGVLLVDRSLISKVLLKSLQVAPPPEKIFSMEELYLQ